MSHPADFLSKNIQGYQRDTILESNNSGYDTIRVTRREGV